MSAYIRIQKIASLGAFYSASGGFDYGSDGSCVMAALSNLTPLPYSLSHAQARLGPRLFNVIYRLGLVNAKLFPFLENGIFFFKASEFVRIVSGQLTVTEQYTIRAVDNACLNYAGIRFVDDCEEGTQLTVDKFIELVYDAGYEVVMTNDVPIVEDHIQAIFGESVQTRHVFSLAEVM